MTKSYTYNGTSDVSYEAWERYLKESIKMCSFLGYEANYYYIGTVNKSMDPVRPIGGMNRKLKNIATKNEVIRGACIYVLPKDYKSACFDFMICVSRDANYITLIVDQNYQMNLDEEVIVSFLKRHINAKQGEIYEMDMTDCPEMYAAKVNSKEKYKSLNILKTLM